MCDESEATASVRSTLKNWLERAMKDPEIKEPVERLKKEVPNIKFKLLYKLGFDGSTQSKYKVSNYSLLHLTEASIYQVCIII